MRAILASLAACLLCGCFVMDELDAADAQLGKATPKETESGATGAQTAQAGEGEEKESWWDKARTISSEEVSSEIVGCDLPGGRQFMKREDCQVRGGRVNEVGG